MPILKTILVPRLSPQKTGGLGPRLTEDNDTVDMVGNGAFNTCKQSNFGYYEEKMNL